MKKHRVTLGKCLTIAMTSISILGRFLIIHASAFGIATTANWANHQGYWKGTIQRVQTVDFNILAHTLPTRLSYLLLARRYAEIQRVINSNYGLFGIVVTNCIRDTVECPEQQIQFITDSSHGWRLRLRLEDLSHYPYDVLRDPPPLLTEREYSSSRDTISQTLAQYNSGQVIGRVYYIRGVPPRFWSTYQQWLSNLPNSLLSDSGAQRYYSLTLGLFSLAGLVCWSCIEWLLHNHRLQKRLAEQDKQLAEQQKTQILAELEAVRQQLHERLQMTSILIADREKATRRLMAYQQDESQRIRELEQIITQLKSQAPLVAPPSPSLPVSTDHLKETCSILQSEIREQNQQIVALQRDIANQVANNQQVDSLQRQLQAMMEQRTSLQTQLEQYQSDVQQLYAEIDRQHQEKQEATNFIQVLQTQLQLARQQATDAQQQQISLHQFLDDLTLKKKALEEQIATIDDDINASTTNKFQQEIMRKLKASSQVNNGEWRVLSELDTSHDRRTRQFADCIVIGTACVFVIEAKNYSGIIQAEGDAKNTAWFCRSKNGVRIKIFSASRRNPYEQVNAYCDNILRKVDDSQAKGKVKVYGIVVFANEANFQSLCSPMGGYTWITTSDKLVETIQDIETDWNRCSQGQSPPSPKELEDLILGKKPRLVAPRLRK